MIKLLIAFIVTAFLFVSASAFADYSQTQNKVDDKQNSPKPVQANPSDKKDDNKSRQNSSDNRDVNSSDARQDKNVGEQRK